MMTGSASRENVWRMRRQHSKPFISGIITCPIHRAGSQTLHLGATRQLEVPRAELGTHPKSRAIWGMQGRTNEDQDLQRVCDTQGMEKREGGRVAEGYVKEHKVGTSGASSKVLQGLNSVHAGMDFVSQRIQQVLHHHLARAATRQHQTLLALALLRPPRRLQSHERARFAG